MNEDGDGLEPSPSVMNAEVIRSWMSSDNLPLHHVAFHTIFEHPEQVPDLPEPERLSLAIQYLERGLLGDYAGVSAEGPYTLAHTIRGWLERVGLSPSSSDRGTTQDLLAMLERVARSKDPTARDAIVLGILEHVFKRDELRQLFHSWQDDPLLSPLYREAEGLSEGF